jgi:DNA-binding response OmpR family regulator
MCCWDAGVAQKEHKLAKRALETQTPKNPGPTALLVSPDEHDHETLARLFREQRWGLRCATSLSTAFAALREQPVGLVITERDLPLGDWKSVLEGIRGLQDTPLLIIISRLADEYLWSEALNLGAYDVLVKPLDRSEAVRVLSSAWHHCQQPASQGPVAPPLKALSFAAD